MAASLTRIREGLAANLAALGQAAGVNVSAYVIAPNPPVIWVRPDPGDLVDYHQAMGNGLEHWHLLVEAFVGTVSDKGAQMKLDELVESTGATSVKAAIESDLTLGGVAQGVKVENAHGYSEYARPDSVTLLGCRWNVLVEMRGV